MHSSELARSNACFFILKLVATTTGVDAMNNYQNEDLEKISKDYQSLVASQQTLLLSTASTDAHPLISYAPYVRDQQGNFYIYTSGLAGHTINLLNNALASIMFIRSEAESQNLYGRERVVLHCRVSEVKRTEELYNEQLKALKDKFGSVVDVLSNLSDFHLFALYVEAGQYVVGFGQAYNIKNCDLLHIQ